MKEEQAKPVEIWVLCKVEKPLIFFLRYTLESHEGLAVPTTLPGGEGLVRIYTEEGRRKELEELLEALKKEIGLDILEWGSW
ncbi:DUF4911 domain-containing protein [bacterium]|nr:MAG: DUF4911 domain-containing protein [bacterium]